GLKNNDFAKVTGIVGTFAGKTQGTIRDLKVVAQEEVELSDFLPSTNKDIEAMFSQVTESVAKVKNKYLKKLLEEFFKDEEFVQRFKQAPAAMGMHNAYLGGLLEHIVELLDLAEFICKKYKQIDKDMLVSGIILHDAAKIKEYQYETVIDYTDWGRLVGHNVMGIQMIDEKIKNIPKFPDELRMLLTHLILSHHGLAEWGSPKQPMTLEAVVLHYLDNLESKIAGFNQHVEKNLQEGTPWTTKAFMFDNRHLYIPQNTIEE
ncbi:MAG: HD domain-containing protein, partial [Candidatus Margulisbacteria bacterium]|nr:HD domain-containing protein [Candidatus Margulisiibacteriota bacterium]